MKIAIAADHAGYPLNEQVIAELRDAGHELIDFGTHDGSIPDDYPDYARKIGEAIQKGTSEIGILAPRSRPTNFVAFVLHFVVTPIPDINHANTTIAMFFV